MKNKVILAYLGLFFKSIIVGLSFIFMKVALKYINPLDLLAHRFTFAFLTLLLLIIFRVIRLPRFSFERYKPLFVISFFYPLSYFALQSYGMNYSSATEAGMIFATLPIMTLIGAELFLKEKNSLLQRIGILLSVFGLFYISFYKVDLSQNISFRANVLLILSILSMASYYIVGKKLKINFSALEITVFITFTAFVFFNILSISKHIYNHTIYEYFSPFLNIEFIWAILYLAVLSSIVTSFLINFSLREIPASQLSIFSNLAPIITIVAGIIFLKEKIFPYQIVGSIFVVIGIFFTVFFKEKNID